MKYSLQKGSALMMVMMGVGIISILALGLFHLIEQSSRLEIARSKAFEAKLLAESGIALGSNPEVLPNDKVLSQELHPEERFDVVISSEQSRLNINALLQDANVPILERLLTIWKIPKDDISQLIARLQDWVDADDLPRLGGAESDEYKKAGLLYLPANRPFLRIEELHQVYGIEILDRYKPDWENFFTVYGLGAADVNEASADALQAVCDVDEIAVNQLIAKRSELDANGRQYRFRSLDEVKHILGIPDSQFQVIAPHLTLSGDIRRIESTGTCYGLKHKIRTFVRYNGPAPIFIQWEYLPNFSNK